MPAWLQIVLALGGSAVISTVIGLLINRGVKRHDDKEAKAKEDARLVEEAKQREQDRLQREAWMQEVRNLITPVATDVSDIKSTQKNLCDGTQTTLRLRLREIYDDWMPQKYAPTYIKEDFDRAYQDYHKLGANGVMTHCYEEFMALPTTKPRKPRAKKSNKED